MIMQHNVIKEVKKGWGKENWIVNNEYCGKIIHLNKGYESSLHYHKNKSETFYILNGSMWIEIVGVGYKGSFCLKEGEIIDIPAGVWHKFSGYGSDCEFIEFSTHHEDEDTIRKEVSGKIKISTSTGTI